MRLVEIKQNSYKLYLDLDGVFSDFIAGVEKLTGKPHSEERYETDKKYKKEMWDAIGKYHKEGGELWYELKLLPDAMQLWTYVKKYNPTFLSATGTSNSKSTEDEKKRWLNEKFGKNVKAKFVKRAEDKQQYAGPKNVLIDDKEKAIIPWIKAGGIGIIHTGAYNTIQQLKQLGL